MSDELELKTVVALGWKMIYVQGRPLVPVPATNRDQRLPARGPTAAADASSMC